MAEQSSISSSGSNSGNNNPGNLIYIYTDIEADSFKANQLLQIAAVTQNNQTFNVYINPGHVLPLSITNILGLYYYKGGLYRDGVRLQSKHIKEALIDFMRWIENLKDPVMLVYHNGFSFDCSVLVRHIVDYQVKTPPNLVKVGDTLPFFRKALKAPAVANHRLSTLSAFYGVTQDFAHDALSDSLTLKSICEKYIENNKSSLPEILNNNNTRDIQVYFDRQLHGTPIPKFKKVRSNKPTAE